MNSYQVEPIISSYLSSMASKKQIPINGAFELSPICNMDCKMCYIRMTSKEIENIGRLRTVEEWLNIAKIAKQKGMLFLLLTGGEPFLYDGFKELYIELKKMGFLITINTNATMIDQETAKWLIENPPSRMNISLYGGSNETYSRLCNNPQGFTQVTNAIKYLKKGSVQIKINATITPYNVNDLEKIYKFAEENKLYVQATSYMFPPTRKDETLVGKGDRFTAKEAANISLRIDKLRFNKETFLRRVENIKKGIVNEDIVDSNCDKVLGEEMNCRAGRCAFWITWDGRMMPCGMMNHPVTYPFRDGFEESWNHILEEVEKIRLYAKCNICKLKKNCHVCAAMIETETGSFDKKPEYVCKMEESFYEEVLREIEIMGEQ